MSNVSNPNLSVSRQDLADFYDKIFPYLGGKATAGFTPVGTVISVMGVTAPANYLACDGTVYNIADYPELARYFGQQFSMVNKFGGNGTTTFAVPDLRGEFLRGTGTNSHSNQGSGANVGVHQDATNHLYQYVLTDGTHAIRGGLNASNVLVSNNHDALYAGTGHAQSTGTRNAPATTFSGNSAYTSRPTNTSVLYCIATKNIYMNPSLDYSTDEKVVGSWIDGKPIYQRTIDCDLSGLTPSIERTAYVLADFTSTGLNIPVDYIVGCEGLVIPSTASPNTFPFSCTQNSSVTTISNQSVVNGVTYYFIYGGRTGVVCVASGYNSYFYQAINSGVGKVIVTIKYTKTTD